MAVVYLGLGSNLGNREANLHRAIALMEERIGTLLKLSSMIETEPEGFCSEHCFLNAAAAFTTRLAPDALLDETQSIERELGRTQKSHDGIHYDRTIDIDLLLYYVEGSSVQLSTPRLKLPHPRMMERDFVLIPLREILDPALCPEL